MQYIRFYSFFYFLVFPLPWELGIFSQRRDAKKSQMESVAAFWEWICILGMDLLCGTLFWCINPAKPLGVGQSWGQRGPEWGKASSVSDFLYSATIFHTIWGHSLLFAELSHRVLSPPHALVQGFQKIAPGNSWFVASFHHSGTAFLKKTCWSYHSLKVTG